MPKYTVAFDQIERYYAIVEADSPDHAQDMIYENSEKYTTMEFWHDADTEIIDIWEV
jgi:hypothetical protein